MRHLFKLSSLIFLLLFSFPAFAQNQSVLVSDAQPVIDELVKNVRKMDRNIGVSSGSVKVRTDIYARYDKVVNNLNAFFALYQLSNGRFNVDIGKSRQALERFSTSIDEFLMLINARDLNKSDYRKLARSCEKAMQLAVTLHGYVELPNPYPPSYPQPNPNPYPPSYPQPNPNPYPPSYPGVPTQLSFQQISTAVAMQPNDQLRAQQINHYMRVQNFTTKQLIDLMRYVRDDGIRMRVAYENYRYVSDAQQNWYSIYDAYNYGEAFDQHMLRLYPDYRVRVNVMSGGDYQALLKVVKASYAGEDKVRIINRVMAENYITVEQLIGLLKTFNFSSEKIDVAAKGYARIVDRNNWYKVYEVFTFSSDKAELDKRLGLK